MINFDIAFDNAGGAALMTEDYTHYYGEAGMWQLAEDVSYIIKGANPAEWDNNEPEYITDDDEPETKWMDEDGIKEIDAINLDTISGASQREFIKLMRGEQ